MGQRDSFFSRCLEDEKEEDKNAWTRHVKVKKLIYAT